MQSRHVTIRQLAAHMKITSMRVRQVREQGDFGRELLHGSVLLHVVLNSVPDCLSGMTKTCERRAPDVLSSSQAAAGLTLANFGSRP
jgi:hypothetical protein